MRTARVLNLCREAEQSVTDCSEHGYAIRKLAQAIREMTEGEPQPDSETTSLDEVVDRLDELLRAVKDLTEVCSSISNHTR